MKINLKNISLDESDSIWYSSHLESSDWQNGTYKPWDSSLSNSPTQSPEIPPPYKLPNTHINTNPSLLPSPCISLNSSSFNYSQNSISDQVTDYSNYQLVEGVNRQHGRSEGNWGMRDQWGGRHQMLNYSISSSDYRASGYGSGSQGFGGHSSSYSDQQWYSDCACDGLVDNKQVESSSDEHYIDWRGRYRQQIFIRPFSLEIVPKLDPIPGVHPVLFSDFLPSLTIRPPKDKPYIPPRRKRAAKILEKEHYIYHTPKKRVYSESDSD